MTAFGVLIEPVNEETLFYVKTINKKLQVNSLIKNPFKGHVKVFAKTGLCIFNLKPIFPKAYWLGLIVTISGVVVMNYYILFTGVALSFVLSWIGSQRFYCSAMRVGARKNGLKNFKVRLLKSDETIERLLDGPG